MLSTYLSIIASLFIIEVLLSVDNALVNATLAESLPGKQRARAIRIGILLGATFRAFALLLASVIIKNVWLKTLGGLYLVYLAISHLGDTKDEEGHALVPKATLRGVIAQIATADLVFSIDNVVSAVSFSENIAVVMAGVGIGILSMLFITPILSKLIERYRGMPHAAYAIVGLIGVALVVETLSELHISELQKFSGVLFISIFTIWYEHSAKLRRLSNPMLRLMQHALSFPFRIKNLILK